MNKLIKYQILNVGNRDESICFINELKDGKNNFEIKIRNLDLTSLNYVCKQKVFRQELAYINSSTLIDLMKPSGGKNHHNYHNLSASEIVDALRSIKNCVNVYYSDVKPNDFILVSSIIAECGDPLIVIIEINASLQNKKNARINKIISIYPKRNINSYLKGLKKK